jgi:hypothetical protein
MGGLVPTRGGRRGKWLTLVHCSTQHKHFLGKSLLNFGDKIRSG